MNNVFIIHPLFVDQDINRKAVPKGWRYLYVNRMAAHTFTHPTRLTAITLFISMINAGRVYDCMIVHQTINQPLRMWQFRAVYGKIDRTLHDHLYPMLAEGE